MRSYPSRRRPHRQPLSITRHGPAAVRARSRVLADPLRPRARVPARPHCAKCETVGRAHGADVLAPKASERRRDRLARRLNARGTAGKLITRLAPRLPASARHSVRWEVWLPEGSRIALAIPGASRSIAARCLERHIGEREAGGARRVNQLAALGHQSSFARWDSVEAAWRVVDLILIGKAAVKSYEPDSWVLRVALAGGSRQGRSLTPRAPPLGGRLTLGGRCFALTSSKTVESVLSTLSRLPAGSVRFDGGRGEISGVTAH